MLKNISNIIKGSPVQKFALPLVWLNVLKEITIVLAAALFLISCAEKKEPFSTWSVYRGDYGNTAYSSLDQINKENVSQLQVAWTYKTGDGDDRSAIQCNPILVNGFLYVTSPKLKVIALDPKSGKPRWTFDPFADTVASGVNRGVAYWCEGNDKRIFMAAGPYLYAIHADDGTRVKNFGQDGKIDLREGLGREPSKLAVTATTPGVIYKNMLIQGTMVGEGYDAAPGFVRAYDVKTGQMIWTFHTIPQPGEFGHDTWSKDAYREIGGVNSWAGMGLDEKRGIVFIPTGSPAFDFYGANRKGKNLFGNCLLALNAATGKLIWHYQLVHHDLWDYDLPAPPNLITIEHEGKKIDAVAQVTKMGMVFIFNRETGEPVFPIEERPVPASDLLGEEVWVTQPFPVKPPPFVRQQFSKEEITNISKESNLYVTKKLRDAKMGSIYTPPSTTGVVQFPGTRGGGEWGGASVDPNTGVMYVNANEIPMLIKMKLVETPSRNESLFVAGQRVYTLNNCTMCHGADRAGSLSFPSLQNLSKHRSEKQVSDILTTGKGQMPAFPNLSEENKQALIAFLFDQKNVKANHHNSMPVSDGKKYRYVHDGWNVLLDSSGYPGVKPPWGTLNAINLNTGEILWQVPLGEYAELTAKGLPVTGTHNLGGPAVTAGGLIFIGATKDEKLRAFDKQTGKVIWEYQLPAGGYATPSVYEVDGKEYVVIAAGGGGKVGSKSGDTYIAFTLKE
jgi:quinoprotein glucose dehydrogenase